MRESTFTRSINKLLPPEVYSWKINDRFTAGVPDSWYSGPHTDLWVEYKFDKNVRKVVKLALTARQSAWLMRQYKAGRNVAVVYGNPNGGIVFRDMEWEDTHDYRALKEANRVLSKQEIAAWITEFVSSPYVESKHIPIRSEKRHTPQKTLERQSQIPTP